MVEVVYTWANGDLMSIMNLLLKPRWSRSWQIAPTHWPRLFRKVYSIGSNVKNQVLKHLDRCEDSRRRLENAVDAVTDMEAMGPVVVGHGSIIGLNCDKKTHLEIIDFYSTVFIQMHLTNLL